MKPQAWQKREPQLTARKRERLLARVDEPAAVHGHRVLLVEDGSSASEPQPGHAPWPVSVGSTTRLDEARAAHRILGSGTGTMKRPPPLDVLGLLAQHLVEVVPGEQEHVVGPLLEQR